MNYFNSQLNHFYVRLLTSLSIPLVIGITLSVMILSSCKKEESHSQQDVFIKSFQSDFDFSVVSSFPLDDGNYLITGIDQVHIQSSVAYKFDVHGNLIWKKLLSPLVKTIWSATPDPETGFIVIGINDYNSEAMYLCRYDFDGNLVSADSIVTGLTNNVNTPHNIIHLSNGNFAIAGGGDFSGDVSGYARIIILDPALQVIFSNLIALPSNNIFIYCKTMCEIPGGAIAIAAAVNDNSISVKKLFVLKTNLQGDSISSNFIDDITHSETPNAIIPFNNGLLAVTATMTGELSGSYSNKGITTNYFSIFSNFGLLASGAINLLRFTNNCELSDRTEIKDYPNNGQINSIRQTNDRGYILCGTVNQLNTFVYPSDLKIYLIKLDANLNVQWSKMINTIYPALGVDAVQTSDDGYLITGFHRTFNKRFEAMIIKTDANGNY